MSYHRFTNMREIFAGDLNSKLISDVASGDYMDRSCNCPKRKTRGCDYDCVCRHSFVVYQNTCKTTGKIYIGNTQQYFKHRMQGHIGDVKNLISKDEQSDSFAKHFAPLIPPGTNLKGNEGSDYVRSLFTNKILWQGNPITATKSFQTPQCVLCAKERMAIFKASRKSPNLLINSNNEFLGACRHNPKFHQLILKQNPSTDESNKDERVEPEVTTEMYCQPVVVDV